MHSSEKMCSWNYVELRTKCWMFRSRRSLWSSREFFARFTRELVASSGCWAMSWKLIKGWQSQWRWSSSTTNDCSKESKHDNWSWLDCPTFLDIPFVSYLKRDQNRRSREKSKFVDSLTECNENILQVLEHDSWVRHGEIVNWKTKETKGRKIIGNGIWVDSIAALFLNHFCHSELGTRQSSCGRYNDW